MGCRSKLWFPGERPKKPCKNALQIDRSVSEPKKGRLRKKKNKVERLKLDKLDVYNIRKKKVSVNRIRH